VKTQHTTIVTQKVQRIGAGLGMVLVAATLVAPLALPQLALARPEVKTCVLEPVEKGERAKETECYRTFAEAVSAATGGQVRLDRDATPNDLTDHVFKRARKKASVQAEASHQTIIGVAYRDWRYNGSHLLFTTNSPNGCRTGQTFSYNLSRVFDNRISSAMSFQGCWATYYENANFTGARMTINDHPSFSALNDKASSVRFTRATAVG
jgi:hypothetical protein